LLGYCGTQYIPQPLPTAAYSGILLACVETHIGNPPTFFFYCNTCNVLPGPAVGWGWCVGVVLRRGVACGYAMRGRGRAGASTVSMGRAAGTAGTVTTASTLPPREEGWMGFPRCGRLLCGVRLLAVGCRWRPYVPCAVMVVGCWSQWLQCR